MSQFTVSWVIDSCLFSINRFYLFKSFCKTPPVNQKRPHRIGRSRRHSNEQIVTFQKRRQKGRAVGLWDHKIEATSKFIMGKIRPLRIGRDLLSLPDPNPPLAGRYSSTAPASFPVNVKYVSVPVLTREGAETTGAQQTTARWGYPQWIGESLLTGAGRQHSGNDGDMQQRGRPCRSLGPHECIHIDHGLHTQAQQTSQGAAKSFG